MRQDALAIQESGRADQAPPDESVLTFAASQERALLTLNRRHFVRLHNARPVHAGIIVCTFDPDFAGQARRINAEIERHETLAGQLIGVNRPVG